MNREERQRIVAEMPWVTRLSLSTSCDGIKWSRVALRDIFTWGPRLSRSPRGIQEKARCRRTAWWGIRLVGDHPVRGGARSRRARFCWLHLVSQGLHGDESESARTRRWIAANHPELLVEGDARGA